MTCSESSAAAAAAAGGPSSRAPEKYTASRPKTPQKPTAARAGQPVDAVADRNRRGEHVGELADYRPAVGIEDVEAHEAERE